jgi:putative tryptophan/tyrosine transport system substrate-binding protein
MKAFCRGVVISTLLFGAVVSVWASGSSEGESESVDEPDVIGISKIVAHPALDAIEEGIMDELAELGHADLQYDLQNANGDISTAASIATKFRNDRVRLAVGIATPTAQALAGTITDIPVIFAAVTDPVGAGLVTSLDRGEGNVTGSSDMAPVEAQFDLMTALLDVETVGHVYAGGESNAVALKDMAQAASESRGLDFVEASVVNSSEVRAAAQSIADRVDVIYVSTDNTVVSALSALVDVAEAAGVPVVSADTTSAEDGGVLVALGFNYYKFGRATGRMISDVLKGADPADLPTLFLTDPGDLDLLINLDVAEDLGISVSDSILNDASIVIENGALR